jgi:hypothetical protein
MLNIRNLVCTVAIFSVKYYIIYVYIPCYISVDLLEGANLVKHHYWTSSYQPTGVLIPVVYLFGGEIGS